MLSDPDVKQLYRRDQLGPARASVTVEQRPWMPSGDRRYVLTETFEVPDAEPGQPDRVKQISVVDVLEKREPALARARALTDQWQRSSSRRDELAPAGNLPELAPEKRARAGGIPGLTRPGSLDELRGLLRNALRR